MREGTQTAQDEEPSLGQGSARMPLGSGAVAGTLPPATARSWTVHLLLKWLV